MVLAALVGMRTARPKMIFQSFPAAESKALGFGAWLDVGGGSLLDPFFDDDEDDDDDVDEVFLPDSIELKLASSLCASAAITVLFARSSSGSGMSNLSGTNGVSTCDDFRPFCHRK
jgi:hypothetical protein